jgi:methylmalonyl-CoA mutase cobalamin-binding domain/chain
VRVLLVQDSTGHSTGYHVVARALRDAGIEVVLGGALLPGQIARLAGEEGVDAIGYRIMDAAPTILVARLVEALAAAGLSDIPVVLGGIVPQEDLGALAALGVTRVFQPGATFAQIADGLRAVGGAPAPRRASRP